MHEQSYIYTCMYIVHSTLHVAQERERKKCYIFVTCKSFYMALHVPVHVLYVLRSLPLQLLSLREQSEDLGHTLLGKPSAPSLSTYTRPFSHTSTLGGYPSLSSTLPPFTTSYKSPYSLSSLSTLPPSTLPPSTLPPSTFSPSTFSPSTLPPSTSVSLEPFKLTFSLPSSSSSSSTATAAASVPDSGRAALPSSNGVASYSTSTDEDTGTCICICTCTCTCIILYTVSYGTYTHVHCT